MAGVARRPAMALLMLLLAAAAVSGNALGAGPERSGVADLSGPAVTVTAGATALLQERSPGGRAVARAAERAAAVTATPAGEPPPEAPPEDPAEGPPPAQSRAVAPDRSPEPEKAPGVPRTGTPPVGGLTQQQMDHAAIIVATGQREGLPEQAYVVAIATALQESNLRNLANPAWPVSLNLPHDGTGYDHDSVGLFQQRPSTGWGPVDRLMDPGYAAARFYRALAQVPGWQGMAVTVAAQSVQRSAFPYHYAKHEPLAREIVDALTR